MLAIGSWGLISPLKDRVGAHPQQTAFKLHFVHSFLLCSVKKKKEWPLTRVLSNIEQMLICYHKQINFEKLGYKGCYCLANTECSVGESITPQKILLSVCFSSEALFLLWKTSNAQDKEVKINVFAKAGRLVLKNWGK